LSPRNGFTAYTCSPRGSGLSCPRCQRQTCRSVAPGSRRQDHTISPYAALLRPAADLDPSRNQAVTPEIAASIASRAQRAVTIAIRPSRRGTGWTTHTSDLRNRQEGILKFRNTQGDHNYGSLVRADG